MKYLIGKKKRQEKVIALISGGMDCYDDATEVLTLDGWKLFRDLTYKDRIATLNPNNDELEYQYPTRIIRQSYRGIMYAFKNDYVDLVVTPNHKMYVKDGRRYDKPNESFCLQEARKIFGKTVRFKRNAKWRGKEVEYFEVPEVVHTYAATSKRGKRFVRKRVFPKLRFPIEEWLDFFGFWLAEGSTYATKHHSYLVSISNSNMSLLNHYERLLSSWGFKVQHGRRQKDGNAQIWVHSVPLFTYLSKFGHSWERFIPLDVKQLSPRLLKILIHSIVQGDGTTRIGRGQCCSVSTTSKRLADDLQEIALKSGISANIRLREKKNSSSRTEYQVSFVFQRNEPCFDMRDVRNRRKRDGIEAPRAFSRAIDFNGEIFCVTVPNHLVYVRRDGVPTWSGNSTISLAWAVDVWSPKNITAVSIHYGQTHEVELESAKKVANVAGVEHLVIHETALSELKGSALLDRGIDVNLKIDGLPSSFVPSRNLLFLSIVGAVAYRKGASNIVLGTGQADWTGYPDTRDNSLKLAQCV